MKANRETRFGPSTRRQALGVVVSAVLMLGVTAWLVSSAATPARVSVALALQLVAALVGVWIARSHITLEPDHLIIVNMRTRRVPYRDIAAAEAGGARARVVVLTLKDGTTVAMGPSAGLDIDTVTQAVRARLPER